MLTALEFANAIGRKKMADALEVGATAVSNAVVRENFPASWLETCRTLAGEAGVQFPVHLFGQKGSYYTKGVTPRGKIQDPAPQNEGVAT